MEVSLMDPYGTNPGPIDSSVLYDQEKHVSSAVWDGQERGALRCHEHTSKLDQWTLTAKQIELVERAGFGYLRLIPAISLDNPLISALVERWRRETNTFHLNVGELTITLKDVAVLLGLAIDGDPVIGLTYTTCHSVCEMYLGRAPDHGYTSGGMVKLSWLKELFSRCPDDAPMEIVERHTRAYLLYLVGSTIFSTTTGNKVPVMYLPLFKDFDQCGKFAWGAAALAFLYRALGNASLRSQSTISGCLTLLQCWSYFHLNIGRPKLNHDPLRNRFPFVLRWKGKQSGPTANRDVVFYRKALDSLKPCDVEWLPYRNMDSILMPDDIKSSLILGGAKTMLICFDKAERHLPDRCVRQYGMLQAIPEDVRRWERKSRGVDGGVDLSAKMEVELNEWGNRRLQIVDGDDSVDENGYMQWYLKITRRFIGRPISLSSEFQRTNSGLRDIAHIADTFSTNGLDQHQIDLISRIRYIAHECLRFAFFLDSDTALAIALEMVEQLELSNEDATIIAQLIDELIAKFVPSWQQCTNFCDGLITEHSSSETEEDKAFSPPLFSEMVLSSPLVGAGRKTLTELAEVEHQENQQTIISCASLDYNHSTISDYSLGKGGSECGDFSHPECDKAFISSGRGTSDLDAVGSVSTMFDFAKPSLISSCSGMSKELSLSNFSNFSVEERDQHDELKMEIDAIDMQYHQCLCELSRMREEAIESAKKRWMSKKKGAAI